MEIASSQVKVLFASNKFSVDYFNTEAFKIKKIVKLKKLESVELFI